MKDYIEKIEAISKLAVIETFEELDSVFEMNSKAKKEDIHNCNLFFHYFLPVEYVNFLENYNGGILFKIEDFSGFHFLGTDKIIKENIFQKENFGEDWDNEIILFCECIGDAEFIGFRITSGHEYEIVYCIMDLTPSMWTKIDNSFENFIFKVINERGKKYWL